MRLTRYLLGYRGFAFSFLLLPKLKKYVPLLPLRRKLGLVCCILVLIGLHAVYLNIVRKSTPAEDEGEWVNHIFWDKNGERTISLSVHRDRTGSYYKQQGSGLAPRLPKCSVNTQELKLARPADRKLVVEDELISKYGHVMEPGGVHRPKDCEPRENMALIIPFRKRHVHLLILLKTLLPILIAQNLKFTIFVAEQIEPTPFNKGAVYNAAVKEALSLDPTIDCFILHDIDMLPLSERTLYQCDPDYPLHFVSGVNKWNYRILYDNLTGGVISFTKDQYKTLNGFSNLFFGWGCEDDDMTYRIKTKYGGFYRKNSELGRYHMLMHYRNKGFEENESRFTLVKMTRHTMNEDGFNSVSSQVLNITRAHLYTWLSIDVNMADVIQNAPSSVLPFYKSALIEYKHLYGSRVQWKDITKLVHERLLRRHAES